MDTDANKNNPEPEMSTEDLLIFRSETLPKLKDYPDIPIWWKAVMEWFIDTGLTFKQWEREQDKDGDSPG